MAQATNPKDIEVANLAGDLGLLENKDGKPRDPETGRFVPSETPPAAQPTEPVKPTHPEYLLDAASYFGISDDEANAMPTEDLNRLCWRMNRAMEKSRREDALQRTFDEQRVNVPPEVTRPAPEADEFSDFRDVDLGIDPETKSPISLKDLHPAVLRLLRGVRKKDAEKIANLEKHVSRQASMSNADIFDDAFESLGKDFERFFGSGPGMEMKQEDANYKRRMAILRAASMTEEDTPRMKKKKIQAAAKEMFGPAIQSTPSEYDRVPAGPKQPRANGAPKPVPRISQEEWDEAGVQVPTHRQVDELPNGDEKAVRNLAKRLNTDAAVSEDKEIMSGLLR